MEIPNQFIVLFKRDAKFGIMIEMVPLLLLTKPYLLVTNIISAIEQYRKCNTIMEIPNQFILLFKRDAKFVIVIEMVPLLLVTKP